MKLLLIPLLLAGAGLGWYGLGGSPADDVPAADPDGCRVTVECTPRGTCLVTCYEEDGSIRCQEEIECPAPCDRPCDSPCEEPCEPGSSCSR